MKNGYSYVMAVAAIALGVVPALADSDGWRKGFHQSGYDGRAMHGKFADLDANGDGAITIDEARASMAERFRKADRDRDGKITKAEIIVAIEDMPDRPHLVRHSGRIADGMVVRFDVNGDGSVTLEEIDNRGAKRFALLDFNDDGKVRAEELRYAGHRLHGRHSRAGFWRHRGGYNNDQPSFK